MGGPGSGRRRVVVNGTNGTNGHTPVIASVTFADVISKMAPAPSDVGSGSLSPPKGVDEPAPATAAPPTSEGNKSFASMAGYIATNVGVSVIGDHLRRKGFEPRDVSGEDLDRTTEATADAFRRALGDLEVPWWAGLAAAWGNLYLAMRVGASKLPPKADGEPTTTPASSAPPPSPLAQGIPPRPPRAPLRPGGPLPAIESSS